MSTPLSRYMSLALLIFLIFQKAYTFRCKGFYNTFPTIKAHFDSSQPSDDDSEVDYSLMTRIDDKGTILHKKRTPYNVSTKLIGGLTEVDDFYQGKYKVVWTIRGVLHKLLFRTRDSNPPPLKTSPFKFSGLYGFVLKLWLDGAPKAPEGYMSMEFAQTESWGFILPKICIFINDIMRGPFKYKSHEYYNACKAVCKRDELNLKQPLKVGVMIAPTSMLKPETKNAD